LRNQRARLA